MTLPAQSLSTLTFNSSTLKLTEPHRYLQALIETEGPPEAG